jgi:cellulose synthase/poly-beta-1,6-N-acetylglucosamine synthase-like glycosyltransferase
LDILIIFFCSIYLFRVLTIKIAAKKCRNKFTVEPNSEGRSSENFSFVSVIVPARNEEKNIKNCIKSILNSNYPKEKFEIIVINDRSTDNTLREITELANQNPTVKICDIKSEAEKRNLQGKPGAIKVGIDAAFGEIIMMTDADCTVSENWISTVVSSFENSNNSSTIKKTGMVCAYTNMKSDKMFHYFQAIEWAYMHTFACAGIGLDVVLGCFGNNISITKEAYNKIGGFDKLKFSVTEDFVLLNAIFQAGFGIKYLCDKNSVVETLPVATFSEYMAQRKRWSKGGADLGWKAVIYVFSSVCLWFAIILSAVNCNFYLMAISIILRFLGDALILFPVFDILENRYLKKWIPFSVCFYSLIELMLPFTLLSRTVKWKDQTFTVKKK